MWKLTIAQMKKVNGYEYEYSVEFISNELSELTMLIERLTNCTAECETSYKLEKVKDGAENE